MGITCYSQIQELWPMGRTYVVGENLRLGTGVELAVGHGENKKLDGVGGPKLNQTDVHLFV